MTDYIGPTGEEHEGAPAAKEALSLEAMCNFNFNLTKDSKKDSFNAQRLETKVLLKDAKITYYSTLLTALFRGSENKTVKMVAFMLVYVYYIIMFRNNSYLALFKMLKLARNAKLSGVERVLFIVNECYIVEKIQKGMNQGTGEGVVDYGTFVEGNHIQIQTEKLIEKTTLDIIMFWSWWKDTSELPVSKNYLLGIELTRNIEKIKRKYNELESKKLLTDYSKHLMYASFFKHMMSDV